MTVYVFLGPTLSYEEAFVELDAIYLPPASQGDVYRVAKRRPRAIGIVDGYFEHVPSVWHKEILWAMSQGIHVYGSASIGALRAAELLAFGMEGVGQIFEHYRDGLLEDDDEVALIHTVQEGKYQAASEALINIRYTLLSAKNSNIISTETYEKLIGIGKNLFYPNRSYSTIIEQALSVNLPFDEIMMLKDWLPKNRIDQKNWMLLRC